MEVNSRIGLWIVRIRSSNGGISTMCDGEIDNTDSNLIYKHVFPIYYKYGTSQPWLRMATSVDPYIYPLLEPV